MTRRESTLQTFVQKARELYSLPAVAVEVLSLADDTRADATQLKTSIERDPALTAKLLRVVNSSLFGLSRQVADLNQAIALLGVKALKLLVLGFSLPERFFANKGADVLKSYWTHTLTRAVACRELAQTNGGKHGEEAFLAGLLGDLGVLVFIQEAGDRYLNMYRRAQDDASSLTVAERRYYGFDHTELTVRLLTDWKLPPALCTAIEQGLGDPGSAAEERKLSPTARLLNAADLLASIVVEQRTDLWPHLLEEARQHCHLQAVRLADLAETVQEKVEQLGKLLNVELIAEHSFRDVLQRAHERLLASSEDVVEELLRSRRGPAGSAAKAEAADDDSDRDETFAAENAEHDLLDDVDTLRVEAERAASYAAALNAAHHEIRTERTSPASLSKPLRDADGPARSVGKTASATRRLPPLSHLPIDLTTHLEETVAVARQTRLPLSLVLVELDRFHEMADKLGPLWAEYSASLLGDACRALERAQLRIVHDSDARWALVLPNTDRKTALGLVDDLIRRFRKMCPLDEPNATTLSCGTATVNNPPRNFPTDELHTAADRCLYAAQAAAGDTSKSIELC